MKIVKYLFLITTIALNCYLIYHSTLPGEVSSKKVKLLQILLLMSLIKLTHLMIQLLQNMKKTEFIYL